MRIGVFTDGYPPQLNGVAVSVYNSVKGLREKGHEVHVVAARYPYVENEKYIIRIHSIPFIKDMNLRVATHLPEKELLRIFKTDFDIIHGHSGGPITFLGFEVARIKKIPYVFTYHTLFNQYTHYILKGKLITPKMAEVGSKFFCNRFDHIVAPTPRIKDELLSYGVTKPITVIPSGIDTNKFDISQKGFLRERLGLSGDQKILLHVGRYAKEKSIDFLINSFKLVAEKDDSSILVLAGNGKKEDKLDLEKLVKKLNLQKRVYFIGPFGQEEIAGVYKDGYVFVFASTSETQGMVIFEALASGLPIIAVKDKVFDGVVKSGENGILTDRDYEKYADQVLFVLRNENLRNEMALKAKQSAQKFSLEKNAGELEKLYKEVLASKRLNDMHEVVVKSEIDLPVRKIWELMTDPKLYPKYVKFVKKVYAPEKFELGAKWKDLTTILWVPGKVLHIVAVCDKYKTLGFDIPMPFPLYGTMIQRVHFEGQDGKTKFNASIKFKINNKLMDIVVAPILKRRLKEMMLYTVEKAQKDREKILA